MSYEESASEQFSNINPMHVGLLEATLRAPSAHNAQPWRIRPVDGTNYEVHYHQTPDLPADPKDKDAYLTMGAFIETMVLEGPKHGVNVEVTPELTRNGQDLFIATIALNGVVKVDQEDPLTQWVGARHTNRNRFAADPLPSSLEENLETLGNILIDPKDLTAIVKEASVSSWADSQYITDLKNWIRLNNDASDGITPGAFNLSKVDLVGLRFAFWRGSLKSHMLGVLYSSRDIALFSSSPRAAVLSAEDMNPTSLFNAGRNLLRSWVTIAGEGYSYQPVSIAVDDPDAASKVANIAQVENPVALYRIGRASKPAQRSNRRPLSEVLIN
ncbi:MAG TPA: hypothetical protein VGS08_02740 [Candidatus Saccharimonadales bacterium]|nr:hypothetical protein [Candidatus Saccharimonadales bacterium]